MLTSLLSTKLYFPSLRPSLVPRPRLLERLEKGLAGPLTLVSAPAGYGKTTLLSEWRAEAGHDYPVAWFSIDSGDNNPFRFWRYVTVALETLQNGLTGSVAPLLQSPQFPPAEEFITSLINSISGFNIDLALVLDDYHLITAPEIHQYLTYLVEHLPPRMHLVLLTRSDPSLPLARLRARGQLMELRADDLRFTTEEVAQFLNTKMGLNLNAENIGALELRTEGWVAALKMAALSLQGSDTQHVADFISGFTGGHHYIVDYLVDEVLNRQPDSFKSFLLQTSILDRLTAALCDALTGRHDGQMILEELERANLFLIPLDEERHWYRYHHLFTNVLVTCLQQAQPEYLPKLHRRAAEWHEQNQLIAEAIHHALAAGDQNYAAQLVERNALPILMRSELITLQNWLKAVEPKIPERPWLCIYQAWVLTLTNQMDRVEHWLQKIEQDLATKPDVRALQEIPGHIAAIRAYGASQRRESANVIRFSHQAMEHLSESNIAIRSVVTLALAGAYWASGDVAGVKRAYTEVRRLGLAAGNLNVAIGGISSLGNLLIVQGELHQACETYREAIQLATLPNGQLLPVAGAAYTGLSMVYYEWNDLKAAQEYAQQAVELCKKWGSSQALATGYLVLAQTLQAQVNLEEAQRVLHEAEALSRSASLSPLVSGWVEACRADLWLAQGNFEAAARWARDTAPDTSGGIPYLRSILNRAVVRVLIANKDLVSALNLLEGLIPPAEITAQIGSLIELLVLQSLALQANGNLPKALEVLERALSLTRVEGYLRVFVDEGEPMVNLLRRAASKGLHPAYVRQILAAVVPVGEGIKSTQPLIKPLSERELEILRLVAAGKSNQKIAEELFLAVGTVKRHVSNIFGKLNAQSRTDCIARGRKLDLLK